MRDLDRLRSLCDSVLADGSLVERPDGTTFCNVAVDRIATGLGFPGFRGLMANGIIVRMLSGVSWRACDGPTAAQKARDGVLALAGERESVHGHVTVIYPVAMQFSGSLSKLVPVCCHVGKAPNGIKRVSQAFSVANSEPGYWYWTES